MTQFVTLYDYEDFPMKFSVNINTLLSEIQSEEGYEDVTHLILDPDGNLTIYRGDNNWEYWIARIEGTGVNNSWRSKDMPGGYEFCGSGRYA